MESSAGRAALVGVGRVDASDVGTRLHREACALGSRASAVVLLCAVRNEGVTSGAGTAVFGGGHIGDECMMRVGASVTQEISAWAAILAMERSQAPTSRRRGSARATPHGNRMTGGGGRRAVMPA